MSGMDTTHETHFKVFVVTRNRHIVPKVRRIELLPTGYSIQECRNDSGGHYWFVITALQVLCPASKNLGSTFCACDSGIV